MQLRPLPTGVHPVGSGLLIHLLRGPQSCWLQKCCWLLPCPPCNFVLSPVVLLLGLLTRSLGQRAPIFRLTLCQLVSTQECKSHLRPTVLPIALRINSDKAPCEACPSHLHPTTPRPTTCSLLQPHWPLCHSWNIPSLFLRQSPCSGGSM